MRIGLSRIDTSLGGGGRSASGKIDEVLQVGMTLFHQGRDMEIEEF